MITTINVHEDSVLGGAPFAGGSVTTKQTPQQRLRTSSVPLSTSLRHTEGGKTSYGTLGVDYLNAPGYEVVKDSTDKVNIADAAYQRWAMAKQHDPFDGVCISASKSRCSTPGELVEWLNGRVVTAEEAKVGVKFYPNVNAFQREVVDEEIGAFAVKKGIRTEVYRFRIVGGEVGDTEVSTLVNMLSIEEGYAFDRTLTAEREPTVQVEYDDEWESKYAPSSAPDRFTIGGTALFDELKEEIALDKLAEQPEIILSPAELAKQKCEWYPNGEVECGAPVTHARTSQLAGVCDNCFTSRNETKETI